MSTVSAAISMRIGPALGARPPASPGTTRAGSAVCALADEGGGASIGAALEAARGAGAARLTGGGVAAATRAVCGDAGIASLDGGAGGVTAGCDAREVVLAAVSSADRTPPRHPAT